MRSLAIVVIFLAACGGKQPASSPPVTHVSAFPGAHWVPAEPTYVVSAQTVAGAQSAFREIMGLTAALNGADLAFASQVFQQVLGFDPLSAESLTSLGVDLEGGLVAFSEEVDPTFVVHLDSPPALTAFVDRLRERGLRTQSVMVAGVEVFTAKLDPGLHLSWAVDKDWLWLHFSSGTVDDASWFEHSKQHAGGRWLDRWNAAAKLATKVPALVGTFDLPKLVAAVTAAVPEAAACARTLASVQGAGFTMQADGSQLSGTLALELGAPASGDLAALLVAAPPGWATASANAPVAAEWNLDVAAATRWVSTCLGSQLTAMAAPYGVRAARGFVHSVDPDELSGRGAVALDLVDDRFFRGLLDQIPGRSILESSRTFGVYKGKHISVPRVAAGDYVLQKNLAIAAMGDGLLATIGTGSPAPQTTVLSIDVRPPGLPPATWEWLLGSLDVRDAKRAASMLLGWSALHVGARIDGNQLVIEAAGNRR